jgi:hypothetical protein
VPEFDRTAHVARLRQRLVASANQSGGWGYYAAKSSRIEPTSWALLALDGTSDQDSGGWQTLAAPHVQFLAACQRGDGLFVDRPQLPPNFTANGAAACALAHLGPERDSPLLARLLDGIVSIKGVAITAPDARQDNSLQAWPWIPDTFSWVEPTSWCLLALKKARPHHRDATEARIQEAEKLLVNRVCRNGGWNYGNAIAFGQDLRPYVPTTAVGLMALQDRAADPAVKLTLAYLERARLTEASAMALGLTAISLRLHGRPAADVEERLAGDVERAERVGNLQTLAMALYAISAEQHQVRAFRV